MSRGLGALQRAAMLCLWNRGGHRAPLSELKREVGGDRSNTRRAIRGLLDRGLVEERAGENGAALVALTGGAVTMFVLLEGAEGRSVERVPGRPFDLAGILDRVDEDEPRERPPRPEVPPREERDPLDGA